MGKERCQLQITALLDHQVQPMCIVSRLMHKYACFAALQTSREVQSAETEYPDCALQLSQEKFNQLRQNILTCALHLSQSQT